MTLATGPPLSHELPSEPTLSIQLLLIHARDPSDPLSLHEQQCIRRRLANLDVTIATQNALRDRASESWLHHADALVIGGSGNFSVNHELSQQWVAPLRSVLDAVLHRALPTFGICYGNQLMALAGGGDTYKLKYGHRSQNQPALEVDSKKCFITSQNHGFAVKKDSLKGTGLEASYLNANDESVEGVSHKGKPFFAVQWHPEACPGPTDTQFLFDKFLGLMKR